MDKTGTDLVAFPTSFLFVRDQLAAGTDPVIRVDINCAPANNDISAFVLLVDTVMLCQRRHGNAGTQPVVLSTKPLIPRLIQLDAAIDLAQRSTLVVCLTCVGDLDVVWVHGLRRIWHCDGRSPGSRCRVGRIRRLLRKRGPARWLAKPRLLDPALPSMAQPTPETSFDGRMNFARQ